MEGGMNRRTLVKGAAIGTAAAALPPAAAQAAARAGETRVDVAVVGGGFAGLYAAEQLRRANRNLDLGKAVFILPRIIKTHISMMSGGPNQIITVFRVTNVPLGVPLRVVDRGAVNGLTLSAENQLIPGVPPPDKYTAVKRDRLNFSKIVRGHGANRRSFLTTPLRCPASGEWTNTGRSTTSTT